MNSNLKKFLLFPMDLLYSFSPSLAIKILFRLKVGYPLNLNNPQTYNEKLNWIKLHDRNPLFVDCADKFTVRNYIAQLGYSNILNELYWEGYNPEDIPFDSLPSEFVIKVTHGSGFNIVCTNRDRLDRVETIKKLKRWLKTKYLKCYGEWWYGVERPRVIIEKLLKNQDNTPLFDYKFFAFNGEPHYVYVDTWKEGKHHINMYDINMNWLDNVSMGYPNDTSSDIRIPDNYDEMVNIARVLSGNFNHVRVDLYSINNNKIVFGELTFTKGAGLDKIYPYSFDLEMGRLLKLPGNKHADN